MKHLKDHSRSLFSSLCKLVLSPHFILLSLIGNMIVLLFAALFFHIEHGSNPLVDERMDAIWWAFTTVTTVGFGDIVPSTFFGRLIGILLMLLGTALFACYVALISDAFMRTDLKRKDSPSP